MKAAVILALTVAIHVARDGEAIRIWPDDALLRVLQQGTELQLLDPYLQRVAAREKVMDAATEAARRGLLQAREPISRILAASMDHPARLLIPGRRDLVSILRSAFASLEVASRDWDRIRSKHRPAIDARCGEPPDRETLDANAVYSDLARDPEGIDLVYELAHACMPCACDTAAIVLASQVARPSPRDVHVLEILLSAPGRYSQAFALRGLMRNLTPMERVALARRYLDSATRSGEIGASLARQVLAGEADPVFVLVERERAELLQRFGELGVRQ